MARLSSDDNEAPSYLELIGKTTSAINSADETERWQDVVVVLHTERIRISTEGAGDFTLCRSPLDEPARLIAELEEVIANKRTQVLFEPQEPSFELNFSVSHHGGIKVEAWVDSGNAQTGFYRWDAAGVRFFTNADHLRKFIDELKSEFV